MPYVEYDEIEAICSECGRVFLSEETLETHKEESHSGIESLSSRTPAKGSRSASADRS